MTDASLYNGQKVDTSSECHGARLTSGTSPITINEGGVLVENVPLANKQWFVFRVSYGRVQKAKDIIESNGIECYISLRYKQIMKKGKKRIVMAPLLPSFVFVNALARDVEKILSGDKVATFESKPLLSFYYDHTTFRQDAPNLNPALVVSDEAMNNFIKLTSIKIPHIIPVMSPNIQYKLGDNVIISDGEFKGVQGRVACIAGQQRVVVELFKGCLIVTAYIPKKAMNRAE
ncbi:transcription termination/antitermination NusG family protein [Prevotella jejuni]